MIKLLIQSVFRPRKVFLPSILRYGWIFIVLRWSYYSLLFLLRDYHGNWAPFINTPFNIDIDSYAFLQRAFSLPFGLILMILMAFILYSYLVLLGKRINYFSLFNILGIAFFFPFVLVQPIDQLVLFTIGWKLIPVSIIHTIILFWESWATVEIVSNIKSLSKVEKFFGYLILSIIWIAFTGQFWR